MLVHPRSHVSMEVVKWILLFVLASALALSIVTHAIGQDVSGGADQPRALPDNPQVVQPVPMPQMRRPVWPPTARQAADFFNLLNVLGLHTEGRHTEAIAAWDLIEMPRATATWKYVGQGAAHLELQEYHRAGQVLTEAIRFDRQNAVAEYLLGVTRVAQAAATPLEPYAPQPKFQLLNKAEPQPPAPSRDTLLLAAARHFQRAIVLAKQCDLHAPLLITDQPEQWIHLASTTDTRPPTDEMPIGLVAFDLVEAINAENYVAQAKGELENLLLNPPPMNYLRQIAQGEAR